MAFVVVIDRAPVASFSARKLPDRVLPDPVPCAAISEPIAPPSSTPTDAGLERFTEVGTCFSVLGVAGQPGSPKYDPPGAT
jgi:hypothetical protein